MVTAFWLKGFLPGHDPSAAADEHLLVGVLSLPAWVAIFWRARLYSPPHIAGRLDEFRRVVQACAYSVAVMALAAFTLKFYVARGWLVLTGLLAVVFVVVERTQVRGIVHRRRNRGQLLERVVIVGCNIEGVTLSSMLSRDPSLGYRPVGFFDQRAPLGSLHAGLPVLGRPADAVEVVKQVRATGVVVATTAIDHDASNLLTRRLTEAGVHVELSSSLCDIASSRLVVRPLGRFPVVYVDPVRLNGWRAKAKRTFDLAVAGSLGLLAAPVLLVAALAVRATSRGPVFFKQRRVGRSGKPFGVLKFRTMVANAESLEADLRKNNEADGPLFKLRHDPRVTKVGRLLRGLSLDEMPQLWNVIRGDMSLVGPRPALPEEVQAWAPSLHQRLEVKPGITGMWQVSGSGRWSSFEDYGRLDLYYVDNWSLWTDLAILAKTIPVVLLRQGTH